MCQNFALKVGGGLKLNSTVLTSMIIITIVLSYVYVQ